MLPGSVSLGAFFVIIKNSRPDQPHDNTAYLSAPGLNADHELSDKCC